MTRTPTALAALALSLVACGHGAPETRAPAARDLVSPAAAGSAEPAWSIAPDGTVRLSWVESAPDRPPALRFATLEGDRFSDPGVVVRASDLFVNWADVPALTALSDGTLLARWPVVPAGGGGAVEAYDTVLARSTDGGATWGAPERLHDDASASAHGFASVAPAADGSADVVWLDGRFLAADPSTGATALLYRRILPDGRLGPETVLDRRVCDCCDTALARTSSGLVAVYRDRGEDEVRDMSVLVERDGSWTGPSRLHDDGWRLKACPVNGPAVAADGDRVAIVWFTGAGGTPRVLGRLGSGDAVRIDGGNPIGRIDVALLPDGDAAVSWIEATGGGDAEVRVRRLAADGGLGAPVAAGTTVAAREAGFPRIAVRGGEVVVAWTVPGPPSRVGVAALVPPR